MTTIEESQPQTSLVVQTRHLLAVTQSLFFLALFWCLLVEHGRLAQTNGISYYGVYAPTVPALIGGFTVAAIGLWRTAGRLRNAGVSRTVWVCLRLVAVDLFVLLATPYDEGPFMNWAHMSAGVAGALLQLTVALVLLGQIRTFRAGTAFSVQLIGGVLAAASLPAWSFDVLLVGQIVYQIGFGWCLIEWTYALEARDGALR